MENNNKKNVLLVAILAIIGALFATFEGIIYYNPFKKSKFWSREYFTRQKKTFLDKYFPIDGPHLVKQALVLLISTIPFVLQDLVWYEYIIYPIVSYAIISTVFNLLLDYYKNKANQNERQDT